MNRVIVWVLLFFISGMLVWNVTASGPSEEDLSPTESIKFIAVPDFDAKQKGVQLLHNYGAFALYRVEETNLPRLMTNQAATIQVVDDMDMLWIDAHPFNTQTETLVFPTQFRDDPVTGEGLQLIQFVGPIKQEWLTAVTATGAQLLHYVANNGYLIWADEASRAQLDILMQTGDFLQFNAPYYSFFKLEPTLKQAASKQNSEEIISISIQMLQHPNQAESEKLIEMYTAVALTPWTSVLHYQNRTIAIKASDVQKIIELPDVVWVGEPFVPELLDEVQGQILAGNLNGGQTGPSGPGYLAWLNSLNFSQDPNDYPIIDITDDGIGNGSINSGDFTLHQDGNLNNTSRVAYIKNCTAEADGGGIDGHGHINASIAVGYDNQTGFPYQDNDGYNIGLGINPFGRVGGTRVFNDSLFYDLSNCNNDYGKLIEQSYASGARISNNSWGCAVCNPSYDSTSQLYDVATRDADLINSGNQEMTFIFAAGNAGPDAHTINTPANAKNVITVGGSENLRPTWTDSCGVPSSWADNAMDIVSYSSRGPAPGGHVKPEIVAPATHIQGTASTNDNYLGRQVCDKYYPAGQEIFAASSGTSHAAPAVAGVTSLYYYWLENSYGISTPSPAILKAYLIAHPTYLTGDAAKDSLPSNHQGYGMPNMSLAFDDADRYLIDQSVILDNTGEDWQKQVTVADPTKPIRIVMAYTDQAGLVGTSPQVNDLNLTIANGGKQYRGNHFSGQWSVEGGDLDSVNNYEAIFLPAGTTGQIDLTITAVQVAGDGVPNYGDGTDQDFALVCYNCAASPDFSLTTIPKDLSICQTENQAEVTVHVASVAGFSEEVSLSVNNAPAGLSVTFSPDSVIPTQSSQLTLGNITAVSAGDYQMTLNGSSASKNHQAPLWLHTVAALPLPVTLTAPTDGQTQTAINPTFKWQADETATSAYLEIAEDSSFSNIVYSAAVLGNSHKVIHIGLDVGTTYYWRVITSNVCGERVSPTWQFSTKATLPLLVVDDDWGGTLPIYKNVESRYIAALSQVGIYFDYWNATAALAEPDAATLANYDAIVWFSGDAYKLLNNPIAGPEAESEPILASYLDNGNCLLLASQEYYYDQGLTDFMRNYLGVAQVFDDVSQTTVTGVGPVFGNLGTYPLDGVAGLGTADPDVIIPDASANMGFIGSDGQSIGIYKETETYRTVYLGFSLNDIDHTPAVIILNDFLNWCQGETVPTNDNHFVYLPMIIK